MKRGSQVCKFVSCLTTAIMHVRSIVLGLGLGWAVARLPFSDTPEELRMHVALCSGLGADIFLCRSQTIGWIQQGRCCAAGLNAPNATWPVVSCPYSE